MNDLVLVFMFICFKKQFLAKVALWPTFKPKRLFFGALDVQTRKQDYAKGEELEPNFWRFSKSRVQAIGRFGNLETKPSRKKLRGFVIKKKTKNTWVLFCTFFRAIWNNQIYV